MHYLKIRFLLNSPLGDDALQHSVRFALENPNIVWTDFLKVKLHPQSITLLPDFQYNNAIEPFDIFPLGISVMEKEHRRETTEDQIRRYAEECDYLQVSCFNYNTLFRLTVSLYIIFYTITII